MLLAVLVLSLVALPKDVSKILWSDKLLHGIAYAGLMGWFAQLFKHDFTRIVLLFGLIFFGVSIELMQAFTPSRKFDDILERFEGLIRPKAARV